MFIATTAVNAGSDAHVVGVAVATQALAELQRQVPGALPQIVFVFSAITYVHSEVLKGIRSVVGPDAILVGASTAGEITALGPTKRGSVAIMCIYSDTVQFMATAEEDVTNESRRVGHHVGISLLEHMPDNLRLVMMFADGLHANASSIIHDIALKIGNQVPIVGGSAGDGGAFVETRQFFQEEVLTDSVVGVGLSGKFLYATGVSHGWVPVGAPRTVTSAEGTCIHTINNQPAISMYGEYLGIAEMSRLRGYALRKVAASYPLGLQSVPGGELLLRAPFFAHEDGSIVCGGEVIVGQQVQLMIGSPERAVDAARNAAEAALAQLGKPPQAAFIFSSHVRTLLFANIEEAAVEIKTVQSVIGQTVPLLGFYSYAEQAPLPGGNQQASKPISEVHNDSVVVVLFSEQ